MIFQQCSYFDHTWYWYYYRYYYRSLGNYSLQVEEFESALKDLSRKQNRLEKELQRNRRKGSEWVNWFFVVWLKVMLRLQNYISKLYKLQSFSSQWYRDWCNFFSSIHEYKGVLNICLSAFLEKSWNWCSLLKWARIRNLFVFHVSVLKLLFEWLIFQLILSSFMWSNISRRVPSTVSCNDHINKVNLAYLGSLRNWESVVTCAVFWLFHLVI